MNDAVIGLLVGVQLFVLTLFYPLRIGALGHVSLAHDKIDINVTVFGLSVVKLRIKREDGAFRLLINGKPLKPPKKKPSIKQIKSIGKQYKLEGVRLSGNLLALVGTQDARRTAMLCAGIYGVASPIIRSCNIYTATASDTFEIDGRLKIKINALQILSLIFAGLRGSNG